MVCYRAANETRELEMESRMKTADGLPDSQSAWAAVSQQVRMRKARP